MVARRLFAVLASLLFASASAATAGCGKGTDGYMQIVVGTLDAGTTTRDAYRLTKGGDLTVARWNDQNSLIGVSSVKHVGAGVYSSALALVSAIKQAPPPQGAPVSVPMGLSVEIARVPASGSVKFVFASEMPDTLKALLAQWADMAPLGRPASGRYLWTLPAPANAGQPDVTMRGADCGGILGRTIAGSRASAHIVVQAKDAGAFTNGGRARYIAKDGHRWSYFGILTAE